MNNLPLVSVIIPVYGVENLLDKCVESVVNQTYKNLEIFLVDDGSPDKCPEMCDEWARRDERIHVLHKENGGQGTARNLALDHATGDYISFVDSDDYILPEMYEVMVNALEENDADMAICDYIRELGVQTFPICTIYTTTVYNRDELFYHFIKTSVVRTMLCNKLYKSHLFKVTRFPTFRANEDAYILPDIIAHCKKGVHVGKPLYVQYIRRGSTENSPFSEKNLALLEVSEHTVQVYREYSEENLFYAEHKQLKEIICLMRKIHTSFSYKKYKNIYQELRKELGSKYLEMSDKYPDALKDLEDVLFVLKHNFRFSLSCIKEGITYRIKDVVRRILKH